MVPAGTAVPVTGAALPRHPGVVLGGAPDPGSGAWGPDLDDLVGLHPGRPALVVGNGPSLAYTDLARADLAPWEAAVTFAFNGAWRLARRGRLRVDWHVVEDRLVATEEAAALAALDPGTTLVLPRDHADLIPPAPGRLHVPVDWSYYDPDRPPPRPGFATAADGPLCAGQTVAYLALQLAFLMGCDPVVMVGMDLDYRLPPSAHVAGRVIASRAADPNHFDPAYFGPGRRWHLPKTDRMLVALRHAAGVYAAHGRRLVNATPGGRLSGVARGPYPGVVLAAPAWTDRQRQPTTAQATSA
nr:6-hydroxymethylpterin diphosphokinase MptE-like protein [Roseospira goensis]